MEHKYKQELPKEVEAKLDAYIERIKEIKWFQPSADLKRAEIDTKVNVALKAFGVEASIEYRALKTPKDWDAALEAAREAARDAAWGANEVLVEDLKEYKGKKAFLSLVDIYEMGVYPIGVVDGKFLVYIPASKLEFPKDFENL